jgi:hypothetical protein
MKGILILSFHKQPGAFVDREFPKGITQDLGIDATDQNKIYSLHRMRNTRPNYLFLRAKNITIASYFSGFDLRQYVGRPNQCVSIILDNHENPTIWEGQLRRIAFELLPILADVRRDEIILSGLSTESKYVTFDRYLADYFDNLKAGRIRPMEEGEGEVLVGDGAKVDTISGNDSQPKSMIGTRPKNLTLTAEDVQKAAEMAKNQELKNHADPMIQAAQQMDLMEKESLRNELRKMHEILSDKNNRIRALESQLHNAQETGHDQQLNVDIARIRGEYEAILASKEDELNTWRAKVAELNENNFINQDNIMKLNEMSMMQSEEMQNQSRTIVELKKKIKTMEANQNAPTDVSSDELFQLRIHLIEVEENYTEKLTECGILQEKIAELTSKAENLQKENQDLKVQIKKKEEEIIDVKNKNTSDLSLNSALNSSEELASVKNELMLAKKALKVQEREIEHLKKIAGFQ